MKAIILAAGEGTRLRPLTLEIPKAMVEVYKKPLLAHNMDALLPHVDEFIIVVKYKHQYISRYFGNSYQGIPIHYHIQGEKKGTAGALIGLKISGDCCILASDTIFHQSDVDMLLHFPGYAMLAKKVKNPEKYGIVKVSKHNNFIEMIEKPQDYIGDLASLLYFKVSSQLIDFAQNTEISPRGEYELVDALRIFSQKNILQVLEIQNDCIDITSLQDLQHANTLTKPKLGETRPLENIGNYEVHLGIPDEGAKQIVAYTLDVNDIALREGTGDSKKRFISLENITNWYNDDGRYVYTLIDTEKNVVGLWWGRPANMPHISEIHNEESYTLLQKNMDKIHTSGVRIYPPARGKGLASKFIEVCNRCHLCVFSEYYMCDDISENNIASQKAFEKLGYKKVGVGKNINNSPESGEIRLLYMKKYN